MNSGIVRSGQSVFLGAALLGAMLVLLASLVLPFFLHRGHLAAERNTIVGLVEAVVAAQIEAYQQGARYVPISLGNDARRILDSHAASDAAANYAILAAPTNDGVFRVQAWPRPDALAARKAAAVSYFVELSDDGEVLQTGWIPKTQDLQREAR